MDIRIETFNMPVEEEEYVLLYNVTMIEGHNQRTILKHLNVRLIKDHAFNDRRKGATSASSGLHPSMIKDSCTCRH